MNRTELRKKIMTILYQIFLYESNNVDYDVKEVIKESVKVENEFVNDIVNGVLEYRNDIDKIAALALRGKINIFYGLMTPDKPAYWLAILLYMLDGGDIKQEAISWEDKK